MKKIIFQTLLCFKVIILSLNLIQAQEAVPIITWDLEGGTLSKLLPQDEDFTIKISDVLGALKGQNLRLIIWDKSNERKIEKELRKGILNNKPITLEDKLTHKWALTYGAPVSSIITSPNNYIVFSPTILKPNTSYAMLLESTRNLNSAELSSIIKEMNTKKFIDQIIPELLSIAIIENIDKEKLEDKFDIFWYRDFPERLEQFLSNIDNRYQILPFDSSATLNLRSRLLAIKDHYQGFLTDYEILAKNSEYGWSRMDQDVEKIVTKEVSEDKKKDLRKQLNLFNTEKLTFKSSLETEIEGILNDYTIRYSIVGTTYSHDIVERTSARLISTTGIGLVFKGINKATTIIGLHYHLRPINTRIPISAVKDNGVINYILRRVAIYGAISFVDINGQLFEDNRQGLLNNQSILGGLGVYIFDGLYLDLGGILFTEEHPNPIISNKKLKIASFIGLSADIRIGDKFKIKKP